VKRLLAYIFIFAASIPWVCGAATGREPLEDYRALRAEGGPFIIHFEPRLERMAMEVGLLLGDSWKELAAEVGLERLDTVDVYITGDPEVYRSLHGGMLPEWGAAYCNSARREIGLDAEAVLRAPRPLRIVIRHELSHMVLADRVGGASVPRWFAEGLAMRQADEWTFGHQWNLLTTIWAKQLPYIEDFDGPLPRGASKARLAYGVSFLAVEELLRERPEDLITLTAYVRDLRDFDRAFSLTFGEPVTEFSTRLHSHLSDRYGTTAMLIRSSPYWGSMTMLFLLAYLLKWYRGRKKLEEWESAERMP
jgi:hypothetical protein